MKSALDILELHICRHAELFRGPSSIARENLFFGFMLSRQTRIVSVVGYSLNVYRVR